MPTFKDFAGFKGALTAMEKDIQIATKNKIAIAMGKRAQVIAEAAASRDLGGDPKFSGWKPELATQLRVIPSGVIVSPTRVSAGPWTVAEFGRNQGNARGFAGPGINIRTGKTTRTKSGNIRKVRARVGKRWNGTTEGKGTASRAITQMDVELPSVAELGVRLVVVKHFDVT